MKKTIIIFLVMIFMSHITCYCSDIDYEKELDNYNVSSLDDAYSSNNNELLKDFSFSKMANDFVKNENIDSQNIFKKIINLINIEIRSTVSTLIQIIGICIIFSFLSSLKTSFAAGSISEASFFICYMILIVLLAKSFSYSINLLSGGIESVALFINAICPILASMLVSGGMISYASIVSPVILISIQILTNIINGFILPLLYIILIINFVGNISSVSLNRFYKLFKSLIVWTLCICLTVFVGIIGISGFSSKTIDGAMGKTIKFLVGSFVPVVGGILTDTLDTLMTCSSVVKGATGITGIITVIIITLTPVIKLAVISLTYRLCAAIIQPIADNRIVNAIDGCGEIIGLMIATMVIVGLMFIIAIAMIIAAVPTNVYS